ncbi:MAG: hypothetical protein WC634_03575 [archaeon]
MSTTGKGGFAFSLDLAVSVIAMVLMLSLMLASFEAAKEEETAQVKKAELQGKAIFLLDAMAKNRNEEQPLLGSALYDGERHRVLANEIDAGLLEKAQQLGSERFFVKSVSLKGMEEKEILFEGEGKECISLDRVVLAGGKKAMLGVILCEK